MPTGSASSNQRQHYKTAKSATRIMASFDELDALYGPLELALSRSDQKTAEEWVATAPTELARCPTNNRANAKEDHRKYPHCMQSMYHTQFWAHVRNCKPCNDYWRCLSVVEKKAANPDYLTPEERGQSYQKLQTEAQNRMGQDARSHDGTEVPRTPSLDRAPIPSGSPSGPGAQEKRTPQNNRPECSDTKRAKPTSLQHATPNPNIPVKVSNYCRGCGVKITTYPWFFQTHQKECKRKAQEAGQGTNLYDDLTGRRVEPGNQRSSVAGLNRGSVSSHSFL
jgi:hypothetical protein